MVGGDYLPRNVKALADEGRLVQIAFLQGPKVELNFAQVMMRRLTITGSTLRPQSDAAKADIAAALREKVWPLLEPGRIAPVMDSGLRAGGCGGCPCADGKLRAHRQDSPIGSLGSFRPAVTEPSRRPASPVPTRGRARLDASSHRTPQQESRERRHERCRYHQDVRGRLG
jgi:hypothetical protein